ncbi:MAG: hypothetical protein H6753_01345 [Candidatus Omnitrophica bacterium]|nr:hypothetical protein [Candidatus Omnitrophota bacterium]
MFKKFLPPSLLLLVCVIILYFCPLQIEENPAALISAKNIREKFIQYKNFNHQKKISIILTSSQTDIFNPDFMKVLQKLTVDIFYLPGVDRANITSLFTNNTLFRDVIEDGFEGAVLIPKDFSYTDAECAQVKKNVLKSPYLGKLVSYDYKSAVISVPFINTKDGLKLTQQIQSLVPNNNEIHSLVLGQAPFLIQLHNEFKRSLIALFLSWLIGAVFLFILTRRLTIFLIFLFVPLITIVLQTALISLGTFPIHPQIFSIIIFTFILSIFDTTWIILNTPNSNIPIPPWTILLSTISLCFLGSLVSFQMTGLALAGAISLVITHHLFLEIAALLPKRQHASWIWPIFSCPLWIKNVLLMILLLSGLLCASTISIGNPAVGPSMLKENFSYWNKQQLATNHFAFSLNSILVLAISPDKNCTDPATVSALERFHWSLTALPSIKSIWSLADAVKKLNAFFHENNIKWQSIPREKQTLIATTNVIPLASGLLNNECSLMPVTIFLNNYPPATLAEIYQTIKNLQASNTLLSLEIIGGSAGLEAILNEELAKSIKIIGLIFFIILYISTGKTHLAQERRALYFLFFVILSLTLGFLSLLQVHISLSTLAALILSSNLCLQFLRILQDKPQSKNELGTILILICIILAGGLFSAIHFIYYTALITESMLILTGLVGFTYFPVTTNLPDSSAET